MRKLIDLRFYGLGRVGGMRATDPTFLFRGLANGQFQLADVYATYMERTSTC